MGRRWAFWAMLAALLLLATETVAFGLARLLGVPDIQYPYLPHYVRSVEALHDIEQYRSDPLFGHRSASALANNYGFRSSYDFPYWKKSGECVLAFFGGSVAQDFAIYLAASPAIKAKFAEALGPGKELVVLNMAMSAGKQPQQFIVAANFVDSYDVSINIDGFNETDVDYPDLPAEYPIIANQLYFHTAARREMIEDIRSAKALERWLIRLPYRWGVIGYSNIYFVASTLAVRRLETRVSRQSKKLQEDYSHWDYTFNQHDLNPTLESEVESLVANWSKYTELQNLVLRHHSKKGLFCLQPNQYVAGMKSLTADEKRSAVSNQDYAEKVPKRYERLRSEVPRLLERDILAFDLTDVFAGSAESIYVDDCCHFNDAGNALLAERLLLLLRSHVTEACH